MRLADKIATMARRGAPLPYLRRVAYLESHGTEWINTKIKPTSDISVNLYVADLPTNISGFIFGARKAAVIDKNTYAVVVQGNDYLRVDWLVNDTRFVFSSAYDVFASQVYVAVNGVKKIMSGPQNLINLDFYFMSCNTSGTASAPMIGKAFYLKISNGEDLVLDLIPVIDLSGRPCFYNQAPSAVPADDPSRFFYNQGSGEFTTDLDVQT